MGAGLAFSFTAGLLELLKQDNALSLGASIAMTAVLMLVALLFTPSVWLLLGLARRKTSEKMAGLMGCVNLFVILMVLLPRLAGVGTPTSTPIYVTALDLVQGVCYVALLFKWPLLDRPVLETPDPTSTGH